MSDEKTTLEVIAPSIEEAISKGLNQLGLPREAVDIEVMDSGSRGLFGLGSRQARIRLTIIPQDEEKSEKDERLLIETSPVEEIFTTDEAAIESEVVIEGDENALQVAVQVVQPMAGSHGPHARQQFP